MGIPVKTLKCKSFFDALSSDALLRFKIFPFFIKRRVPKGVRKAHLNFFIFPLNQNQGGIISVVFLKAKLFLNAKLFYN